MKAEDLDISEDSLAELESGILMFYTGIKRSAGEVLQKQQEQITRKSGDTLERMHKIKAIGSGKQEGSGARDLKRYGELLHEHWLTKRGVTDNMTSDNIDRWYPIARKNGANGGKLIGAVEAADSSWCIATTVASSCVPPWLRGTW